MLSFVLEVKDTHDYPDIVKKELCMRAPGIHDYPDMISAQSIPRFRSGICELNYHDLWHWYIDNVSYVLVMSGGTT